MKVMVTGIGRAGTRLGWGILDQGVSSLGNFLLGVFVARSVGAQGLGALAMGLMAYAICVNASRGVSTDPLMVRYSGDPDERWRTAVSRSTGTALLVGAAGGLVCGGIGAVMIARFGDTGLGWAFVAIAIVLPGLTLQDSWRYSFFASGQGAKAFTNDVVWTVLLVGALSVTTACGLTGARWALLVFGGAALVAAGFGVWQSGVRPRPWQALTWLRLTKHLGPRFLLENITLGAGSQTRTAVVAMAAGLVAAGGIRGAEMLIGPLAAILMGVAQVAVPEAARWLGRGRTPFLRLCLALSTGLATLSVVWGAVVLVVFPYRIGEMLLGSAWDDAYVLVPGVVAAATAGCLAVGPSAGLRALERADASLRAQIIVSVIYAGFGAAGGALWGAQGAVWSTAVAAALGAVVWWRELHRAQSARFHELRGSMTPAVNESTGAAS